MDSVLKKTQKVESIQPIETEKLSENVEMQSDDSKDQQTKVRFTSKPEISPQSSQDHNSVEDAEELEQQDEEEEIEKIADAYTRNATLK